MSTVFSAFIKKRGKPKARPRVTSNGTFMPKDYMAWRDEFGWLLKAEKPPHYGTRNIELHLGFQSGGVQIVIIPIDVTRPTHVRADLDNLIGSVCEVLEDLGIVENDRQVVKIIATAYEGKDHAG